METKQEDKDKDTSLNHSNLSEKSSSELIIDEDAFDDDFDCSSSYNSSKEAEKQSKQSRDIDDDDENHLLEPLPTHSDHKLKLYTAKKLLEKARSPIKRIHPEASQFTKQSAIKLFKKSDESIQEESSKEQKNEKAENNKSEKTTTAKGFLKRIVLNPVDSKNEKKIIKLVRMAPFATKSASKDNEVMQKKSLPENLSKVFASNNVSIKRMASKQMTQSTSADTKEKMIKPIQFIETPTSILINSEEKQKEKILSPASFPKAIIYPSSMKTDEAQKKEPQNSPEKLSFNNVFAIIAKRARKLDMKHFDRVEEKNLVGKIKTVIDNQMIEDVISIPKPIKYVIPQDLLSAESDKLKEIKVKPKTSSQECLEEPFVLSNAEEYEKSQGNNQKQQKQLGLNKSETNGNFSLPARPEVNSELIETLANNRIIARYLFNKLNIPQFDLDATDDYINMYKILRK